MMQVKDDENLNMQMTYELLLERARSDVKRKWR